MNKFSIQLLIDTLHTLLYVSVCFWITACGDKTIPEKIKGRTTVEVNIGYNAKTDTTDALYAAPSTIYKYTQGYTLDTLMDGMLSAFISSANALPIQSTFPYFSLVALQITGEGIDAVAINKKHNNNQLIMNAQGQVVLTDTQFTINVPDDVPQTFTVTAYNLGGFRLYRGTASVTLEQLKNPRVQIQIAMQFDVDELIPRLAADNGCSGDSDGDGVCNDFEDAILNTSGEPDIDGDGIPNSLDTDSDNDGVLDVNERVSGNPTELGKAVTGFPYFTNVNHAPQISGTPTITINPGEAYLFTPQATDAEGDTLSFSILNKPAWATFNEATGELSGSPTAGDIGTYMNISIAVSDWQVSTGLPAFNIQVLAPANNPPVITLLGDEMVNIVQGSPYVDPGATANDAEEGDISGSIAVSGLPIDTSVTGSYTITYNVSDSLGLAAIAVSRTVNVLQAGSVNKVWQGGDAATPTNWSVAENWLPVGVPLSVDNVTVSATALNQPVLSENVSLANLSIESGASVNISGFNLNIGGNIVNDGVISGTGSVIMAGTDVTLNGMLPALRIERVVSLSNDIVVNGDVIIEGLNSNITLNGFSATVNGNFEIRSSGDGDANATLTMNNTADTLNISGNVLFNGGNSVGKLTAGIIQVGGNFTQSNAFFASTAGFSASQTHSVILNGGVTQMVGFDNPDAGLSHFNNIIIENAAGLTITNIVVNGRTTVSTAFLPTIHGTGSWTTEGVDINGLVLDGALINIVGEDVVRFDNVTFQNQAVNTNQMSLSFSGVNTTFNGLQFNELPIPGSNYIVGDGASNVSIINATPAFGIPRTTVSNGFVINWGAGTEDSDADGLIDADEFNIHNTNPVLADTDGDAIYDGEEVTAGLNPLDDTSPVFALPIAVNSILDFEANNGGLFTTGTLWQHGEPTSGPGVAYDGVNVWATNLAGNYTTNQVESLYLAPIDLSNSINPTLSLRFWSAMGSSNFDGAAVEVYDSAVRQWDKVLPAFPVYDSFIIVPEVLEGWTNHFYGNNYTLAALSLQPYLNFPQPLKLRVKFRSNSVVFSSGIYIDDIRVTEESDDQDGDGISGVINEFTLAGSDPFLADTDRDGANDGAELSSVEGDAVNPAFFPGALSININNSLLDFEVNNGGLAAFAEIQPGLWPRDVLWEHGTPTSGPNIAFSGNNVWATNLSGNYFSNAREVLYLPPVDLTGITDPTINFRMWTSGGTSNFDGTSMEKYNPVSGEWELVNAAFPAYMTIIINPNLYSAWVNHNAPGFYVLAALSLQPYLADQQPIKLRLIFRSNSPVLSTGTYIDNLRLDDETVDHDGDGLPGIITEFEARGTDPFQADTDNDGLIDGVETNTGVFVSVSDTGTNPNNPDTDGDNFSDGAEVAAQTDPNDPLSTP